MTKLQPAWAQPGAGGGGGRGGRGGATGPNAFHQTIQRSAKTLMDLLRAGVPVIAGVDAPLVPYGAALHTEIAGYVEAGFTPFQALQTATMNTATLLNVQNDLGSIEAGKLADLVIVDGNPLVNIRDTMRVRTVIANGNVYPLETLLNLPKK